MINWNPSTIECDTGHSSRSIQNPSIADNSQSFEHS